MHTPSIIIEEYLEKLPSENRKIISLIQKIVQQVFPEVTERIMYGGIMFSLQGEDFGGVFPYTKHISFEFSQGHALDDPNGFLEGKGKLRRHIKLRKLEDIEVKQLTFFLLQIG